MKNMIKSLIVLLCLSTHGCSWVPWANKPDDCAYLMLAFYQPPVVGRLDYAMVAGFQKQAIVQPGFQHTLSLGNPAAASTLPLPPLANKPTMGSAIFMVRFPFDSTRLGTEGQAVLDGFLNEAKSNGYRHVLITGHTDSTGSRQYNKRLSVARANSVKDYLQRHLSGLSIETQGLGESSPAATNLTETGRQSNRRAELSNYSSK
jgi:outer membrane protein OmpA-like peptidoglycan-associated protein